MLGKRILTATLTCALGLLILACAAPAATPTAAPKAAPTTAPAAAPTKAPTAAPAAAPTKAPAVAPTAPPKEAGTVRLGYVTAISDIPTIVAMRQKLFEEEGLKMEYVPFAIGRNAVSALVGGSLDIAVMMATPFITTTTKADNRYVILGVIQYHGRAMSLVVKKGSNIKTVADLKGKKIGTQVGSQTHYALVEKFMPRNGLREQDYQVVNLDAPQCVSALAVGAIDAFAATDPYPIQAEADGVGVILEEGFTKDDPSPVFYVTSKEFLAANPTTVTKFLKAHMRASKLITDDFPTTSKILKQFLESNKITLSQELVDRILKRTDPIPFFIPNMAEYLDDIAQREKRLGNIPAVPNWNTLIVKEYLDKAASEVGVKDPYK